MPDRPNLSEALNPEDRRQRDAWLAAFRAQWTERLLDEQVRRLPPATHPLRLVLFADMVLIDLERHLALGRRPRLANYLRQYPELDTPEMVRLLHAAAETVLPAEASILVLGEVATTPGPPPTADVPLAPGPFGKYRLERLLGKGGMGEVWLAHDTVLDRKVAIKRPRNADDALLARLKREAQAVARLDNHPSICRIYELGDVDGQFYLALAYVEGKTLQDVLDKGKPIPPLQAVEVARRLADALEYAHGQNVVHRDLKPANVVLRPGGDPVVMDFGLAGRIDTQHSLTSHGRMIGTPAYMAPEQARGEIASMGPAWDIFSLGAILYEMLAGRRAFDGPTFMGVVYQVQFETPPPPSSLRPRLDPRLDAICARAMAKQPAERYASMKELERALREVLRNSAAAAATPRPQPAPPPPAKKEPASHPKQERPPEDRPPPTPPIVVVPSKVRSRKGRRRLPAVGLILLMVAILAAASCVWWQVIELLRGRTTDAPPATSAAPEVEP